ncbi:MAG: bifunctional N-acetylglucosamine-1-phosphate uridyltransferase/glucosamine-1-phosphate acetyltransferase [Candidatus Riflebacteria bacterium]|nr:bifunctional N-acetylglucosamine-1-phosphate uridyltransferase/glucosamine-1-phosphate acetyltransferase [Candidatus Riflebacteria bacterium]
MGRHLSALILAAGKGVRMKSPLPKVMHPVLGRPMVCHVIDAVRSVGADPVHVVVGFGRERLELALAAEKVRFIPQTEQLGTGHAVQCFARQLGTEIGITHTTLPEHILVVCGDTPLISRSTLAAMVERHFVEKPAVTMLTLEMADPGNYGRITRDTSGRVMGIREAKDCSPEERAIREINLAVYLFDTKSLLDRIFQLKNENRQKEYYLTDMIEMFSRDGLPIIAIKESDELSTLGINSRADLARVNRIMAEQIMHRHLEAGVTIEDPGQTLIEPTVEIAADTIIRPGTLLTGRTRIGGHCIIGPQIRISDSTIGDGVHAEFCVVDNVHVADNTRLKPFSVVLGENLSHSD